jgi:hypothetical protein
LIRRSGPNAASAIPAGRISYYLKPAGRYFMAVGAFDNREQFVLAREIYVDHKPPGYDFAGDLPKQTEAEVLAAFGAG